MKTIHIKTLTELSQLDGRVYVHMTSPELEKQFMEQAEAEGFTFADGAKPTEREQSDFIAVNADHTINYIGVFGRMAYSIKSAFSDGKRLIRIMHNGEDDWLLED